MTGQRGSPVAGRQGLRRFLQPPAGAVPTTGPAGPGTPAAPPRGAEAPAPAAAQAEEACELCAAPIGPAHGHLADLENSTLNCACRACYLLFTEPGAGRGRYRAVPDRYLRDPARPLTAAEWAGLDVPVGLAFFLHSSQRGQVCGALRSWPQ